MDQPSESSLLKYFAEFDDACARIQAGTQLDFIEDSVERDACTLFCSVANQARISYAVLRNNAEAAKLNNPDNLPGTIQFEMPDESPYGND